MALSIRLMRTGKTKQPSYRIIVKERRSPRSGEYLELLGHYDPLTEPVAVKLEEERIVHWLSVGALPTDTVRRLILAHSSISLPKGKK